jgi:hypothetical protein
MSDLSPLSGVKRKSVFGAVRAAFDPKRTLSFRIVPSQIRAFVGTMIVILTGRNNETARIRFTS